MALTLERETSHEKRAFSSTCCSVPVSVCAPVWLFPFPVFPHFFVLGFVSLTVGLAALAASVRSFFYTFQLAAS